MREKLFRIVRLDFSSGFEANVEAFEQKQTWNQF